MKIKIERTEALCETEVTVRCSKNEDQTTKMLLRQLEMLAGTAVGYKDGTAHKLALQDIFYIESVDEKTFFYLEAYIYETPRKLYEWEKELQDTSFVRISKSTILNTDKLCSVRPMLSGRLEAALENGEKQVVNRHYVDGFRKKFGI